MNTTTLAGPVIRPVVEQSLKSFGDAIPLIGLLRAYLKGLELAPSQEDSGGIVLSPILSGFISIRAWSLKIL